jgi:hypothetical protein
VLSPLAGALPAAETTGFNAPAGSIQEGEVGPIPHSEISTLAVYLGLSDLADTSSRGRPSVDGQGRQGGKAGLEGVSAGPTGGSVGSADGGLGGMDLDLLLSGLVSAPSLVESTSSSIKRSDSMASGVSSDTEGGATAKGAVGVSAATVWFNSTACGSQSGARLGGECCGVLQ